MKKPDDVLLLVSLVLSGVVIGGMSVFLFSRGWTAEWVETAGTWAGAIGTVLALVWAVRVFRSEQRRKATQELADRRFAAERVDLRLVGGGSIRPNLLTDGHIEFFNDSDSPVRITRVDIPTLEFKSRLPIPIRLRPLGGWKEHFQPVAPVQVEKGETAQRPILSHPWTMEFECRGETWRLSSDRTLVNQNAVD